MNSKIVVCEDLEFGRETIVSGINSKLKKIYFRDELKVDDAHDILHEAYITEEDNKYIIISAKSFNQYAQNSLLKLLEEPPRNIVFILIVRNKAVLLPTIRSRLGIESIKIQKRAVELGIDLKQMDMRDIFGFLKEHKFEKKDDLKILVQEIVRESIIKLKIDFSESEYEMIDKLLVLSELNTRAQNILSYLLLLVYRKKNDKALKQ